MIAHHTHRRQHDRSDHLAHHPPSLPTSASGNRSRADARNRHHAANVEIIKKRLRFMSIYNTKLPRRSVTYSKSKTTTISIS